MHCPSCGQQQISVETKFCSRCGLPLSIVAEVLFHGGYLPQLAAQEKKTFFNRRNGIGFSIIWLLFFLLILAPLWGIMGVDELAAVSAVIGIFGGLIFLIFSAIFLPKPIKVAPLVQHSFQPGAHQQGLQGQTGYSALPPQQSIPASAYQTPRAGNWRDTNDLAPGTVTEGTTKLLEKDEI